MKLVLDLTDGELDQLTTALDEWDEILRDDYEPKDADHNKGVDEMRAETQAVVSKLRTATSRADKIWDVVVDYEGLDTNALVKAPTREEAIAKLMHQLSVQVNSEEVTDLEEFRRREDLSIEEIEFDDEGIWVFDQGT